MRKRKRNRQWNNSGVASEFANFLEKDALSANSCLHYLWPSVNADYRHASIVGKDRVVFNIGGNRYRLVVRFDYGMRIGFVRFVGTHAEYDGIDASLV